MLSIELFYQVKINNGDPGQGVLLPEALCPLLAFLVLKRDKTYSRRDTAEILFSRLPSSKLMHRLSNNIYRLKHYLKADDLTDGALEQDRPILDAPAIMPCRYSADVLEFEHVAKSVAALNYEDIDESLIDQTCKALDLFKGDILPNCDQDWLLLENQRLRSLRVDCLEKLMKVWARRGKLTPAISAGKKILDDDPYREDIHYYIMELHLAKGDRISALRQHNACAKLLMDDLNIEPMPEIKDIYRRVLSGDQIRLTPLELKRPVSKIDIV